jgi:tetratricopeptide (TPR) repeat protein
MNKNLAVAVASVLICATAVAFGQGRTDYGAWVTGAKIDYKGGRYSKAALKFRNAIAERPTSAEARYWLGLSLAQIGRESLFLAAGEFDSCFSLDSSYVTRARQDEENVYLTTRALSASADAKMVAAEYLDAARYVRWAMAINPDNPNYYMTLGNAYVGLDMVDSIRAVAEDLEKRDPQSAQVAFFMGIYYSKKEGQMDSALMSFETAGMRYEAGVMKQKERLVSLLKLKSLAEADPIAERLVALRNDQTGLKVYIEVTLNAGNALQQVAEVANNLFIDRFQIGVAFYRAGMAAVKQGHETSDTLAQKHFFIVADTLFAHAAQGDPDNYDALWYIGYVNYRLMQDSATLSGFRRAINLSEWRKDLVAEKDAEVWLYLGTAEARLKMYDTAVAHLHRAIMADPTNNDAYANLAFVFKDLSKGNLDSPFTDSAVKALDDKEKTGLRFTVWDVASSAELGTLKPAGGMQFLVVDLTVFNKNEQADSVDPARLTLTGDDKKSYAIDEQATSSEAAEGKGLRAEGLEPRKKLEALAVFSVPRGVKAQALVYKPKSGGEVSVPVK